MGTIFQQLKDARESREMSIDDVALATNINPDLLRAIDDGRTDMLPQAYVRAFLREYAAAVGLDPVLIMEEYDRTRTDRKDEAKAHQKKTAEVRPLALPKETSPSESGPGPAAFAVIAVVLLLIGILYWNYSDSPADDIPPETEVPGEISPPDTTRRASAAGPTAGTKPDTLVLSASTRDSVWVLLVVDGGDSLDFILRPGMTRSWKAAESIQLSVGRPEAVDFSLNGLPLGALGTGRVIRNRVIDHTTLARLKKQD